MQSAHPSTPALKSTQIVAGVAVVLALLGGAYAVGRSQAPIEPAPATESQASPDEGRDTAATAKESAAKAPVVVAQAPTPSRRETASPASRETAPLSPAERERQTLASLCERCALVTDVHTESRRGQGSGLGAVGGAVVGGLLGNMVGGGNGRKLATVGGAVAGGYAGNEIEKNQKTHTVWVVQAKDRDGQVHRFERSSDPGVQSGDQISLHEGGFSPR
ncbi:MAG: hypothetical protein DI603_06945 [Roseateles depolymerans]|uniref:Glycine zipper 2TM domain-containing protein n=1 Tax=Roseateles depolymerans TaxID=76731 RepID=A0A2W5DYU7_9BURK|nr:MAG: hypothetical protein DI603_06945 [Roseateles depolymerans]